MNDNNENNKLKNIKVILTKVLQTILAIQLIIIVLFYLAGKNFATRNNSELEEEEYVVKKSEIFSGYQEINEFLISDNKIYYSIYSSSMYNSKYSVANQNSLNYMNFDDDDPKIVCDYLKYRDVNKYFYFINNNELFYANRKNSHDVENRKINLNDCSVTNLIKDYTFIKNTNTSEYVYMYNYDIDTDYLSIIKYDYNNDKVLDKMKVPTSSITGDNLVIDYDNFTFYYIEEKYKKENSDYYLHVINKDNIKGKKLYEIKEKEMKMLLLTEDYLFFYTKDKIYQLDKNNNEIVNEMENKFSKINKMFSDNNDNYFIANKKIYTYKNNEFISLFDIKKDYDILYHYGNKLIFDDSNSSIAVYNLDTKNYNFYNDIYYDFNDGNIYIININGEDVDIQIDNT